MQFVIICVVAYAALCSAEENDRFLRKECLAQYLQLKGKLSIDSKTYVTLTANPCSSQVNPDYILRRIKSFTFRAIKDRFESDADCLKKAFSDDDLDDIAKMATILSIKVISEVATDPEIEAQFTETENELKPKLEIIAAQCNSNIEILWEAVLKAVENLYIQFE